MLNKLNAGSNFLKTAYLRDREEALSQTPLQTLLLDRCKAHRYSHSRAGLHKFELAAQTLESTLSYWAETLQRAGIPTTFSTNPIQSEWEKALWNITVNGLCSIVNTHNGAILDHPELREIAENILEEAVAVAKNEGIMLDARSKAAVFGTLEKLKGTSMPHCKTCALAAIQS